MKRKTKVCLLGGLVLLSAALTTALWRTLPHERELPAAPAPECELSRYILRESDGCVAVYRAEDALTPEQVTDIEVALLPASDRARLSVGIGVESRAELLCLLEDLGS